MERGGASRELIDPSEVIVESHDSLVTKEHFSSLEGVAATPQEILLGEPLLLIRYYSHRPLNSHDFTVTLTVLAL